MRKRAFFFHYNKPASLAAKQPRISCHVSGQCMLVDNIVVGVPTEGRVRTRQPYFVMVGKAANFVVKNRVLHIS